MRILKQITAAVLACVVAAGSAVINVYAEDDQTAFETFCQEEFVRRMESDYLTMHYTLKDYEAKSVTKPEVTVGDGSWESYEREVENTEKALERLHAIDPEALDEDSQRIYFTYERYLESMRELNAMPLYDSCFDPASGVIDNLLTNFTEFRFYREEDVEDYLTALATVPDFIDDVLDVTKRQAEEGFFLRDDQLDMTEEAIDDFTAKKEDSELIVIFNNRIDELEGLSDAEKAEFKKRNRDIVINAYIPAYEKAGKELEKLRGSRSYEGGTANYRNGGKEYYAALARYKTSSNDSVEKMLDDCGVFLETLVDRYIDLYLSNPEVDDLYLSETTALTTPDEVLRYLQSHLDGFPEGPEVTYEYDYLDPSVANDSTIAYYLSPPIDDIRHNVIKINEDAVGDDPNELYSTLAHEAFPGHLFQITWFMNTDQPDLRYSYDFMGYQEGWGMYSEWCAWEFSDIDPDAAELNRIYVALSYVEDAAVDLAVNGLGWNTDEVANWLEGIGLNGSSAPELVDFVVQRPALLLPYGVGLMRFLSLRWEAEKTLGTSFDLKEFNRVLLEGGDRPFEFVEEDVRNYLSGAGASEPKPNDEKDPIPTPDLSVDWRTDDEMTMAQQLNAASYTLPAGIGVVCGVIALIAGINLFRRKRKGPFA